MREVIVDTETTGVDPALGHRVVEIGCVEIVHGMKTGKVFHTYLNPQRDMPPEAEAIHGLSSAFLQDKPLFAEQVDAFLSFIAADPLVIHNAPFDLKFINAELAGVGFPALDPRRVTDTLLMARAKFPGSPASLDALCKRFEVDLSGRVKHGALLDCELLAEVYVELTGGRQAALVLDRNTQISSINTIQSKANTPRAPRDFPLTEDELSAHTLMRAKLKQALWDTV